MTSVLRLTLLAPDTVEAIVDGRGYTGSDRFCGQSGVEVMAGGWARDGAVNEQIEASIEDELKRMQARRLPEGESLTHCAECDEAIPEARRAAIPGVKLCTDCQRGRDARPVVRGGINRRGSKDSQLK